MARGRCGQSQEPLKTTALLSSCILYYLGGDVSLNPYEPLIIDTALDNTIKKYISFGIKQNSGCNVVVTLGKINGILNIFSLGYGNDY